MVSNAEKEEYAISINDELYTEITRFPCSREQLSSNFISMRKLLKTLDIPFKVDFTGSAVNNG